jgi:septal ring factor EnvC (AmiA/AmiB activator)
VTVGSTGWDVSWLEFMLAKRGFDPGTIDGRFTRQTKSAVVAFARFAGIEDRCHAHAPLFAALRRGHAPRPRLQLAWPVQGKLTRSFGIHGARLYPGVTLGGGFGTRVAAAAHGRVTYAAQSGPLGLVVMVKHRNGVVTVYGHLARIDVRPGDPVLGGALIGLVGETGKATQPGLYFEVRVRGASVDPLSALPRP